MGVYNRYHKGINYTIDTVDCGKRGWDWRFIVFEQLHQNKDKPSPTEQIAIDEAEENAKWIIDNTEF